MKILYLFLDGTQSPGVISKVKSKIRFLNRAGLDVKGIFMNRNITEYRYDDEERIVYLPLSIQPLSSVFNRRYIRNYKWYFAAKSYLKQFYRQLEEEVAKHPCDLILFRYPLSNKYLYRFCRRYSGKIVFEHNSKELYEMEMANAKQTAMQYYIEAEKKYAPLVLSSARALTGVGREVTAYQEKRSGKPGILTAVIPNGIDVGPLPVRKSPGMAAGTLELLFVTGSPSPWVGIDILLNSLEAYKGPRKFQVSIVGRLPENFAAEIVKRGLGEQVTLAGEKRGKELDAFFDKSHIALGTLAMQRVGLQEHSSLKVLEYAARGIPFVICYEETNFSGIPDFAPFYDQQPYDGKTIDLDRIAAFADRALADSAHPEKMRALAEKHLDFSVKMKELELFLRKLVP